jgi:hypothetical protein
MLSAPVVAMGDYVVKSKKMIWVDLGAEIYMELKPFTEVPSIQVL